MRVQMWLKLLPDILVRCYTVGSSRWPLHCVAGCCRPGSSPSSGRHCPAGPRSPGTAWTPASWQCLSLPLCQEGLPTRSPRRASLPRSQSCHAHRPCSGRWGCGAGWSRSSSRKHCGSSRGSSDRAGRPWAVQDEKTGATDLKKLTWCQNVKKAYFITSFWKCWVLQVREKLSQCIVGKHFLL